MSTKEHRSSKTLLIVRHAHRDKPHGREADNGLSEKGRAQAKRFAKFLAEEYPKSEPLVMSSPKLRCIETVERVAQHAGVDVEVSPLLDEGSGLMSRAREFVRWWKQDASPLVVACSHGDWIPVALGKLIGSELDLEKGGCACVEFDAHGETRLAWLRQEF